MVHHAAEVTLAPVSGTAVRDYLTELARASQVDPAPHEAPAMTQSGSPLFERTVALLAHAPVETRAHLLRALHLVADSLGHGDAVTLSRHEATVTTQEAADVLGISRPTLVRLLEQGAIPFSQPSRHRRILLADVLAYQASHDGIHQGSAPETNGGGPGAAAPPQA